MNKIVKYISIIIKSLIFSIATIIGFLLIFSLFLKKTDDLVIVMAIAIGFLIILSTYIVLGKLDMHIKDE